MLLKEMRETMKESQETKNEIVDEPFSETKGITLDAKLTDEVINSLAKTNPELSNRLINIRG